MSNRNYKDSVFVDYFDKDEEVGQENFLALYNAYPSNKFETQRTSCRGKRFIRK